MSTTTIKNSLHRTWGRIASFFHWYKNLYVGTPWYKKTFVTIVSLIVMFFAYLGAVDLNLFWLFGKSPGIVSIWSPKTYNASEIYSADGELIGKYYNENRIPVQYGEVNPVFWKALIDTEDERFYRHFGVDPEGMLGVAKDAITGHSRGGSTITQQLAKNMFRVRSEYSTGLVGKIPGLRIVVQKTKEWIIATKLELLLPLKHNFSRTSAKEEILTMYANTVDYGNNSFGIKTACKTYYNKKPDEITTDEAALLVGVLKGTTLYDPKRKPENALKRRNVVLDNMVRKGDLTKEEYEEYSSRDLNLNFTVEENFRGKAMYFREAVAKELENWCEDNGLDLYTAGLKIYTTIDMNMQRHAETAVETEMEKIQRSFNEDWNGERPWAKTDQMLVEKILKKLPVYTYYSTKYGEETDSADYYLRRQTKPRKVFTWDGDHTTTRDLTIADSIRYQLNFMRCSMIAMDPENGHVKAYVGGLDFTHWKYDAAQAAHQAGSTFKLFVYTEAMNQGFSPCDRKVDAPFTKMVWNEEKHCDVEWTPRNANGSFSGDSLYLKTAFARSVNSIAAKLGDQVGIKNVLETAHKMGIKSDINENPSVALGACDVTLMELVNAYCTVANYGRHIEPKLVTTIKNYEGKVLVDFKDNGEQVLPERTAYLMQRMLMAGRTEAGGTSQRLNEYIGDYTDTDFGGKTGTTNNNSDAWYVAISPNMVVGAWVGGEYRSIHFRSGALGQGARTALPIVGSFLKKVLSERKKYPQLHAHFKRPDPSEIPASMWDCSGVIHAVEVTDTLYADSLDYDMEEYPDPDIPTFEIDEEGAIVTDNDPNDIEPDIPPSRVEPISGE